MAYGAVFAKSEVELNGAKAPNGNRDGETNLGDLITDAMLWSIQKNPDSVTVPMENVLAITNGGGIRAPIHKGDVTKKDVNTVLPFGNTVAVVYVTGAELLEALEASTYCTPKAVGGFPQVSGIEFIVDTSAAYDANDTTYPGSTYYGPKSINRVTIIGVNGEEFDPEATYAVITNNFLAAGGDTYYAFANASAQFDTGLPLDEVLMDYITEELGGVIGEEYAQPQGRIVVCDHADAIESITVDANCTEAGFTAEYCTNCGLILSFEEISALGHTFKDGKCTVCGEADPGYKPAGEVTEKGDSPATGDTFSVVYVGLAVSALMGTAVMIGKKKEWF